MLTVFLYSQFWPINIFITESCQPYTIEYTTEKSFLNFDFLGSYLVLRFSAH